MIAPAARLVKRCKDVRRQTSDARRQVRRTLHGVGLCRAGVWRLTSSARLTSFPRRLTVLAVAGYNDRRGSVHPRGEEAMIIPGADRLEKAVGSKYALVIVAAKRARFLKEGSTP